MSNCCAVVRLLSCWALEPSQAHSSASVTFQGSLLVTLLVGGLESMSGACYAIRSEAISSVKSS
jgi:hypothetical protein